MVELCDGKVFKVSTRAHAYASIVFEVKSVSCIPNSGRVVACYSSKPKTNQADGDKELSLEQLYTFISQQEIRATSLQQEKKQEMVSISDQTLRTQNNFKIREYVSQKKYS